ncbi:hypothetical protein [Neisseria macacae]|uniref:Uncharacterized protein n=1 Tax=Neisseria macacae ATCC 33926 TaxID=997348 RepID=A0AA36XK46_9NEIS|nr:hypothetical protein [Neisseria macacae]EGQ76515.1 hypothetical protein HMPREF9418_1848 [Neisseria macacae ATCC 33926]
MSQIPHYFIILSEHNIAEYRACLDLRPQNVHLIVTGWIAGKKRTHPFQKHARAKRTI